MMKESNITISLVLLIFLIFLNACNHAGNNGINTDKLFSEVPVSWHGVNFKNSLTENYQYNHMVNEMFITGAGVAVGDLNNDGLADLFFTGNQVQDRLYLNKGGMQFIDVTEDAGILSETVWSSGVTFGDVNNDGYMDIYVCKFDYKDGAFGRNLLYINDGPSHKVSGRELVTFTERGSDYNLDSQGFSIQASFFDFNKDGNLDLYLVNQPPSSGYVIGHQIPHQVMKEFAYLSDQLFQNLGNGTFKDITGSSGVNFIAKGLSASIGDLDNDGWPDIYVANDYEKPDRLYINQKSGRFENQIDKSIKHISYYSMGSDIADYDNDGFLDVMVADMVAEDHIRIKTNMGGMNPKQFRENVEKGFHHQYMFNTLQRNNGNGTFSELAHLAGVSNTDWSWAPLFGDFDNDGWKDLLVTNGIRRGMRNSDYVQKRDRILDSLRVVARNTGKNFFEMVDILKIISMAPEEKLSNYIFKNNGDLTFTKMTEKWGLDLPTLSNGAAYADLDNDGDLDLVINNIDDHALLYRNNTIEKRGGNFLRIIPVNSNGAPAYGARVTLFKNNKFWQMLELINARGYESKSEDVVHFGIGKEESIDRIEIVWPSGNVWVRENVTANQTLKVNSEQLNDTVKLREYPAKLFYEITDELMVNFIHRENEYDDYIKEPLLPHKMSNFGSALAVGDVNQDGLEDFYAGNGAGHPGALFIQQINGQFLRSQQPTWESDKSHEDIEAAFLDVDNDGDLDLYVVSGGNEIEPDSEILRDRLYLNKGRGNFSRSQGWLPDIKCSGSCVLPADYDEDGDLDLFIGGRLIPGHYPVAADSYLLRNDGGRFVNVTEEVAPSLKNAGLITAGVWTDFSGDGLLDLAIVGEWTPVKLLKNNGEQLTEITQEAGLLLETGWYYSIASEDIDLDGDEDFIVGNLGLNYKYRASRKAPFEVYSGDFDNDGQRDIVLGYHEHGELFPLRGRSCSSAQIPSLAEKFPTFQSFGEANLFEIYGPELQTGLNCKARNFASLYIENLGDGTFKTRKLPNLAQVSAVNSILIKDFSGDGYADLLISGNLYPVEIETPRNDAGVGLYLTGDGKGNFKPVQPSQSGFLTPHDAKGMQLITIGSGIMERKALLVANNQERLQIIECIPAGTPMDAPDLPSN